MSNSTSSTRQPVLRGLYRGILRRDGLPLSEVFDALSPTLPGTSCCVDHGRGISGAHMRVDSSQGAGTWNFLRIRNDLFMAAMDAVYDDPRQEMVLGEGHYEFYAKLSGKVRFDLPHGGSYEVRGPAMVFVRQARGVTLRETLHADAREICAAVHCRPEFLRSLLDEERRYALNTLVETESDNPLVLRQFPLTPALAACIRNLLSCPYEGALRLLYLESKVLEFLCHALANSVDYQVVAGVESPGSLDSRLDMVRARLVKPSELIPSIEDLARSAGISESKLKRDFKAAFGKSIVEYALERRMTLAMNMLRAGSKPVGEVAAAVGYRHHTSFTAAFRRFYGFSPRASGKSGSH